MMPSPAPPSSGRPTGHAVARSSELLSCARTALRISQQQHKQQQQQQLTSSDPSSSSPPTDANTSASLHTDPSSLTLHQTQHPDDPTNTTSIANNPAMEALHHATLSLRLLDSSLTNLSSLVRRRGHTNDPTDEIHKAISQFRLYATEIKEILEKALQTAAIADLVVGKVMDDGVYAEDGVGRRTKSSRQRVKHYETVGLALKERVEERMKRFKEVMAVREEVIKDLTRRRKELLENDSSTSMPSTLNGANGARARGSNATIGKVGLVMPVLGKPSSLSSKPKINSQLQSPLFTNNRHTKIRNTSNNTRNRTTNGPPKIGGKGGYGGNTTTTSCGYGGGYNPQTTNGGGYTGLRQRPTGSGGGTGIAASSAPAPTTSSYKGNTGKYYGKEKANDDDNGNGNNYADQQCLLEIKEQRNVRRTKDRLRSARQAETMLADLTNMFGKMSEMIRNQGETLTKIEDDVEAGHDNVNEGAKEIGKLYEITKGNRSLIIKVFAILIFFIIAMKWF